MVAFLLVLGTMCFTSAVFGQETLRLFDTGALGLEWLPLGQVEAMENPLRSGAAFGPPPTLATTIAAAGYVGGMLLIAGVVSAIVVLAALIWVFRRKRPEDPDQR